MEEHLILQHLKVSGAGKVCGGEWTRGGGYFTRKQYPS